MAQQRGTHVPRFGTWDANDHAPFTKVFDTARAGRGGKMMNPNDPEQNPDAFLKPPTPPPKSHDASHSDPHGRRSRRASREEGELRKYMGSPARKPAVARTASSASDHGKLRSPLHPQPNPKVAPTLPKFGDWDAKDPSSGEGFTVIFNNARNEKQSGGPGRGPQMNNGAMPSFDSQHHHNQEQEHKRRNWFCCFS